MVPAILNLTSKRKKLPRERRVNMGVATDKKDIVTSVSADRERQRKTLDYRFLQLNMLKTDRDQRWTNSIADNLSEGFGQEQQMPIRSIADSFKGRFLDNGQSLIVSDFGNIASVRLRILLLAQFFWLIADSGLDDKEMASP